MLETAPPQMRPDLTGLLNSSGGLDLGRATKALRETRPTRRQLIHPWLVGTLRRLRLLLAVARNPQLQLQVHSRTGTEPAGFSQVSPGLGCLPVLLPVRMPTAPGGCMALLFLGAAKLRRRTMDSNLCSHISRARLGSCFQLSILWPAMRCFGSG